MNTDSGRNALRRLVSMIALSVGYGAAIAVAKLVPRPQRRGTLGQQRILVIGNFDNPNWFLAHITPLAQSGIKEVLLVADGFTDQVPGVRLLAPPRWADRLLTRAGAKFVFALWHGLRLRPSLYVGYAIFPAATTALILGRLFRSPACFQLTSGPLELDGGGFHAENRLLCGLGKPSRWIERLAHALTRQFDLMVVRGSQGHQYVRRLGYRGQMDVITGSIEIPDAREIAGARDIDLIFVGRLTERKRPERFLEIVSLVSRHVPHVRAVLVGDGPDRDALEGLIDTLGIRNNVALLGLRKDVGALLARSKIFVLTSRWEGVSIAMLEAMAAAVVPVANDVGDLADIVRRGENGYLVEDNDVQASAAHIVALLRDESKRALLAAAARETVVRRVSRNAVAQLWRDSLSRLFAQG
jgi:glycosyltransferase involved in cell wall biosynthesis